MLQEKEPDECFCSACILIDSTASPCMLWLLSFSLDT